MQALAWAMADAYYAEKPIGLMAGEWHLPYIDWSSPEARAACLAAREAAGKPLEPGGVRRRDEAEALMLTLVKASVARCARVSYLNHDGSTPDIVKDLALYEQLVGNVPLHASPAEHQATAWPNEFLHGNFVTPGNFVHGWTQYRKTLKNEYAKFDYATACVEQR